MENTTKKRIDNRKRGELARKAGRRVVSFEVPEEFHTLVGRLAEMLGCTRVKALIHATTLGWEIILAKSKKK